MFCPLNVHSHFSLQTGISKPKQIVEHCKKIGYLCCALTDDSYLAGIPTFFKECHDRNIKPIAGCQFRLHNANESNVTILAKNEEGWKGLTQSSSFSNQKECFYKKKPHIILEKLAEFSKGNFIVFSGGVGSELANICFENPKLAYTTTIYEEAKSLVKTNWKDNVIQTTAKYKNLFGKNFFFEIQIIDKDNLPASLIVAKILRSLSKELDVACFASCNSFYCNKEDAPDQRVVLCNLLETTLKGVNKKLELSEEIGIKRFFNSNNYHIPKIQEVQELYTEEEINNTQKIADECLSFKISGQPLLPSFDYHGKNENEYLRELCRIGWKERIENIIEKNKRGKYVVRIKEELDTITEFGLAGYFLIVQDYIRYAKEVLKCKVGEGRGSSAGSLICHLIGITGKWIEPLKYNLLFSRFINRGRLTKDRISLPDIDTDFPIMYRDKVIDYLKNKYGHDKVCQMSTFTRIQGRGALKDVLRVHDRCSFEEMNRITKYIPDESRISDDLQTMAEENEDEEPSIIRWSLENNEKELKQWCFLNEEGELEGDLAIDFAQAIRLEGTKRSQGKHPSGVIISKESLANLVPMIYDRTTEEQIVGLDMRDAELVGLVKFDILGTTVLDKIMMVEKMVRGEI